MMAGYRNKEKNKLPVIYCCDSYNNKQMMYGGELKGEG